MAVSLGKMSVNNSEILQAIAKKQSDCILKAQGKVEEKAGFWSKIKQHFPTTRLVSAQLGGLAATAHGPTIANQIIDSVVSKFFPQPQKKLSFWERALQTIKGVGQVTVAESLKVAITPQLAPFFYTMGVTAGGVAAGTVALAITSIYAQVIGKDSKKLEEFKSYSLDQLFTLNSDQQFVNAYGHIIDPADIKDLKSRLVSYDLAHKLSEQAPDSVRAFIYDHYLIQRKDGQIILPSGKVATEEQAELIHAVIGSEANKGLLERENLGIKNKEIKEFINLLAENQPSEADVLSKPWQAYFTRCDDGIYCAKRPFDKPLQSRENLERGDVFHYQGDIEELMKEKDQLEVEKEINDFELVKPEVQISVNAEAVKQVVLEEEYQPNFEQEDIFSDSKAIFQHH